MEAYEGVNLLEEQKQEPFDMHCPAIHNYGKPQLNYWKSTCELRQRDKNIPSCFGGCNVRASPKIDSVLIRLMKVLRNRGEKVSIIAELCQVSESMVSRYTKKKRDLRGSKMTQDDWKQVDSLIADGVGDRQIAHIMGRSLTVIWRHRQEVVA